MPLLDYLRALTFDFEIAGKAVSAVRIYAEPNPEVPGQYLSVTAAESGVEGVACVDDTARAALLALGVYERTGSTDALATARRWLRFVAYMQHEDGSFANFILDSAGTRNERGRTSEKGGHWWSARALWALTRAYRITNEAEYLDSYQRCYLAPFIEGKINALLVLAKLELYQARPSSALAEEILEHCRTILRVSADSPFFLDQLNTTAVHFWGYHQIHALAVAGSVLDQPTFLARCRETVEVLIEPDIAARMWHGYPTGRKDGVTAYDVSPIVQGLSALYRVASDPHYLDLALLASEWFYGRNDAGVAMYDPTTGRCRDGITGQEVSDNYGAESAIEAGLAELERQDLLGSAGRSA